MKRENLKADLTLLDRYVKELKTTLEEAYKIRDEPQEAADVKKNFEEFMVALSKSVGFLAGITNEAGLLVNDLQKIAQYSEPNTKGAANVAEFVQNLLSPKGGRGEN